MSGSCCKSDLTPCTIQITDGCTPKSPEAERCFVIEGSLTVLVPSSQDGSLDEELKSLLYNDELEYLFNRMHVEDPNVIAIEYVGHDASSLSSFGNVGAVNGAGETNEGSGVFTSVIIGISGSLVAIAAVVAATKKVQKIDDPVIPGEKGLDDQSEAQRTSDLTYSNSLDDHSEVSSLSPTNRYCPERVAVVNDSITKHFILAEEEESNWKRLGIHSAVNESNQLLEVYEEDVIEEQSI